MGQYAWLESQLENLVKHTNLRMVLQALQAIADKNAAVCDSPIQGGDMWAFASARLMECEARIEQRFATF